LGMLVLVVLLQLAARRLRRANDALVEFTSGTPLGQTNAEQRRTQTETNAEHQNRLTCCGDESLQERQQQPQPTPGAAERDDKSAAAAGGGGGGGKGDGRFSSLRCSSVILDLSDKLKRASGKGVWTPRRSSVDSEMSASCSRLSVLLPLFISTAHGTTAGFVGFLLTTTAWWVAYDIILCHEAAWAFAVLSHVAVWCARPCLPRLCSIPLQAMEATLEAQARAHVRASVCAPVRASLCVAPQPQHACARSVRRGTHAAEARLQIATLDIC